MPSSASPLRQTKRLFRLPPDQLEAARSWFDHGERTPRKPRYASSVVLIRDNPEGTQTYLGYRSGSSPLASSSVGVTVTFTVRSASSMSTCRRVRNSGFIVVSHSCCGIISPRPLKRCGSILAPFCCSAQNAYFLSPEASGSRWPRLPLTDPIGSGPPGRTRLWGRDAEGIYPPVDTDEIAPSDQDDGYLLVAARLARGDRLPVAVTGAVQYLDGALRAAYPVGSGHGPVDHLYEQVRA